MSAQSGYPSNGILTVHLVACKRCDRQYDCTSLDPGSRVRCACDAVFEVPPPRALTAQALLCSNCGGPLGPHDEACPYCSAAISEEDRRRTTLCPKCWARIASSARHCAGCGVRIQPQALLPLPGRACPRCAGPLGHRALGEASAIECVRCGGLWLQPAAFHELCHQASLAPALPKPVRASAPALEPDPRYLACPMCGELMTRRQFRHAQRPSAIVIDVCRRHGLWLDGGELEAIGRFLRSARAPGLDWDEPAPVGALAQASHPTAETHPRFPGPRGWARLTGEALVDMLDWILGGLSGPR